MSISNATIENLATIRSNRIKSRVEFDLCTQADSERENILGLLAGKPA